MRLAKTSTRVLQNTDASVNERIRRKAEMSIAYHRQHPGRIDGRLAELDREWDIERALETGSSSLTLAGFVLSLLKGKRWILLSLGVQGFFLQHALSGWCPPLPVLRQLGFRTQEEIQAERHALLSIRDRDQRGASDDRKAADQRRKAKAAT